MLFLLGDVMQQQTLRIQPRDIEVLKFLDMVGYAPVGQIAEAVGAGVSEKTTLMRRLSLLCKSNYLKRFPTQNGSYYALARKGRGSNNLIISIKLDQLQHHDFLTQLFLLVQNNPKCFQLLSEREVINTYKTIGKNGKVPDMIINDWIIEYERTSKSVRSSRDVVDYWTSRERKMLCVIYETNEIKNRYSLLLNPRVKLLAREDFNDIFQIVGSSMVEQSIDNNKADDAVLNAIRSKYL